jgi:muconate cycloisomerase
VRIESITVRQLQIPFRRAFRHAAHERNASDTIVVEIRDDAGRVGWGEIVPRPYVTGETVDEVVVRRAPTLARLLLNECWEDSSATEQMRIWLAVQAENDVGLATLCGFDLALHDIVGQATATPVAQMLGGVRRDGLPAGAIVGFEIKTEKLAHYCASLRLAGRRHIKVKVGQEDDAERLALVGKVFKNLPLRIDANAAWSAEESIEKLREFAEIVPIASIEQPVAADDLDGLRMVRERTGIKVMADESVCSLADAERLLRAEAVDVLNVRLGKNGGLAASVRLVQWARQHAIEVNLGTMVGETGILSRAGEIFGRCEPGFACLDGRGQNRFLLEVDILDESSDHLGSFERPGLGIAVSEDRLASLQVNEPRTFTSSTITDRS